MKYILNSTRFITPTTLEAVMTPVDKTWAVPQPGQYISVAFKRNNKNTPSRCFSVVDSQYFNGALTIAMRVGGDYTKSFSELRPGSELRLEGAFGDFFYDSEFDKKSLMIAGGIGITPILSIIRTVMKSGSNNLITLLYAVPNIDEAAYAEELIQFENSHNNFRVVFVVKGPSTSTASFLSKARTTTAKISDDMLNRLLGNSNDTSFFICGSDVFTDRMTSMIKDRKVADNRINAEAFSQAHLGVDINGITRFFTSVYSISALAFLAMIGFIAGANELSKVTWPIATSNTNTDTTTPASSSSTTTYDSPSVSATSTPTSTDSTVYSTQQPQSAQPTSGVS